MAKIYKQSIIFVHTSIGLLVTHRLISASCLILRISFIEEFKIDRYHYIFYIIFSNGTLLQIKTSPGNQSDLDSSIPVRIYWERPRTVFSFIIVNWEFTYKPDPVINSISPLTSIIR